MTRIAPCESSPISYQKPIPQWQKKNRRELKPFLLLIPCNKKMAIIGIFDTEKNGSLKANKFDQKSGLCNSEDEKTIHPARHCLRFPREIALLTFEASNL